MAGGVDFGIEDNEPEITGMAERCLVYYVVTLTYCRQESSPQAQQRIGSDFHHRTIYVCLLVDNLLNGKVDVRSDSKMT